MALGINKQLDNGFAITYLKASKDINLSYSNKTAEVILLFYKDKATRDLNLSPVLIKPIVIKNEGIRNGDIYEMFNFFDDFIIYFEQGKYIEGVYNFIKTHPEFKSDLGEFINIY